jgi:hypothetical protein
MEDIRHEEGDDGVDLLRAASIAEDTLHTLLIDMHSITA